MKKLFLNIVIIGLLLFGTIFGAVDSNVKAQDSTNDFQILVVDNQMQWFTGWSNQGFQLTVVFPDGMAYMGTFTAEETPVLSLEKSNGSVLPDGLYKFQLLGVPEIVINNLDQILADREAGIETPKLDEELLQVWTGSFTILKGSVLIPQAALNLPDSDSETKDIVQADDVIVQGSLCVGFDCINAENFGFDTVRLKENNLRIKFEDTSASSGFPTNDWQITINDSATGGLNYFAIYDVDAGKTPFLVEAGARTNALYIDSSGRIGLGTNVPAEDIHMIVGDTPTIRLDQQGGGWSPQIWDVAGNEANFFIRDVTNGSKLPFRIKPGAPTDSLIIKENGFVGIGTYNPEAELHVAGDAVLEGYLSERSDMFAKENFKMVNGSEVLERLSEIPISVWNYKDDENKTEHMGPMAQDFYAAFGLGKDDTHIAALDVNGVVLASIQELSKTITEKETEIQVLNDKVNSLETRLEKLESATISSCRSKSGTAAYFWNRRADRGSLGY